MDSSSTGWRSSIESSFQRQGGAWRKEWLLTDFLNYFTVKIRRKFVIILSLKIPPHLKCVATLPCEMSSVLKATVENKTISVTTHFKEINKEQRVYCLSYKVTHVLQFLHQMFDLFALLPDDPLKPATPLISGAIDETLQ